MAGSETTRQPLYGVSQGRFPRAARKVSPQAIEGLKLLLRLELSKMPLDTTVKKDVITKYAKTEGDTGSPEVQIAVMQSRIAQITGHLKTHKKDFHSRRGLMVLVGKRRRLEGYLRRTDIARYRTLIQELGIREVKPR